MSNSTTFFPFPDIDRSIHAFADWQAASHSFSTDPAWRVGWLTPDVWRNEKTDGDSGPSRSGVVMRRREEPSAEIHVRGFRLPREVSPGDFLVCLVREPGHAIQCRNDVYGPAGTVSEFLVTNRAGDRIGRVTCLKNGAGAVLFGVWCDADVYGSLAAEFAQIVGSLRWLTDRIAITAEPLRRIGFRGGPLACEFAFPGSWQVGRQTTSDGSAREFVLRNHEGDRLAGRVQIRIATRATADVDDSELKSAVTAHVRALRETGVKIGGTAIHACATPAGFEAGCAATFPVQDSTEAIRESSFVCWIARERVVSFTMDSPSWDGQPLDWAVNKRALEIICESWR